MIRHLPWPKEQDWRAVMTQLSDHSDSHYQSRPCGQPSSGIPSYAGRVELTSHVATCGDRCTEWLHVVLSAPCSTEAKHGSVDVAEQAWSAVGRLRDGLTDAGWCDHPQALADACTASTCPISCRLPWADGPHTYGPRQVQEAISVLQRGGGVGSSDASVLARSGRKVLCARRVIVYRTRRSKVKPAGGTSR